MTISRHPYIRTSAQLPDIRTSAHPHIRTILLLLLLFPLSLPAASPGWVLEDGTVVSWRGGTVSYHPEAGECGPYSNAEIVSEVEAYIALWDESDYVALTLSSVTGEITEDITGDNYAEYAMSSAALGDGMNPVVFDDDGEIMDSIGGEGGSISILGFAGPSSYDTETGEILEGDMVLNCRCLADHPRYAPCESGGEEFTFGEVSLFSTATHEFGHMLGLDHSQVNYDAFDSDSTEDNGDIPLMFPSDFEMEEIALTTEDIVSLAIIYPAASFTSGTCVVTGTLLASNGGELRCADVQAVTDDPADTFAYVSGALAVATDDNRDGDTVDSGECASGCGDFSLYLFPGKDYTVKVVPIAGEFTGGSGLGPCYNEQLSGIVEEEIADVNAASCTGGQTSSLGSLQTVSTPGVTPTGGGGGGDDDDDEMAEAVFDTMLSTCAINRTPRGKIGLSQVVAGAFLLSCAFVLRRRKLCP